MVHFVGAGPGAPDLITLRGAELLKQADVIIYAGSLVNPALLELARADCEVHNSAEMTLEQVIGVMKQAEAAGKTTVRLHTGDPCVYGAIREQMDALDELGIPYDDVPGVSSFCAVAARLGVSLTEMNSPLHIAPGGMALDEVLDQPGTKVLMKSGRQMPAVLDALAERDMLGKSMLVQNCGLPGETVYPDLSQSRPEGGHGYFSTVIVKE